MGKKLYEILRVTAKGIHVLGVFGVGMFWPWIAIHNETATPLKEGQIIEVHGWVGEARRIIDVA